MGDQNISRITDPEKKRAYTKHLLSDIHALEKMIEGDMFESDVIRIGAEQEIGLVGSDWRPAMVYNKILKSVNDKHFTTELGRFNIEINLDPLVFAGSCFSDMHTQLDELLRKAKEAATKNGAHVLLTGIMPTLTTDHLQFKFMTPNPRYEALNDVMKGKRDANFELNIVGIDELKTSHPNILFEACNTSFQIHFQLTPKKFVPQFNWAQAIAGPVLAVAANSPLFMGKRLWAETRIALLQQSIDTRNTSYLKRDIEPRVTFGKKWLENSVIDLYKDSVSRYNMLFATDDLVDSLETLDQGEIPKLKAMCLHSGTVYMWNRICYGISDTGKPHLRIENQFIPSGPTTIDEMANAALWLGLMAGLPKKMESIHQLMDFEEVRYNFYNAARSGLESNFKWLGKTLSAEDLLQNELLPIAFDGLRKMKVDETDIQKYLGVIQERILLKTNGANWIIENFNELVKKSTPLEASVSLTRLLPQMENLSKPVHKWPKIEHSMQDGHKHFYTVAQIMSTDIPTVNADDIIELVINFMVWRNVRYIAVENNKHELVGLVASRMLVKLLSEGWKEKLTVKDIMVKAPITVSPKTSTGEAIALMSEKNIGCLPVVTRKRLVGMLTEREIVTIVNLTQKFHLRS